MMDAIKLDIKTEAMAFPDYRPEVHFAVLPGLKDVVLKEGFQDLSLMHATKVVYRTKKVFIPQQGIKYFLVNDSELFEILLKITNSDLERIKIEERTKGYSLGEEDAIDTIKTLPWWKRLFNKF